MRVPLRAGSYPEAKMRITTNEGPGNWNPIWRIKIEGIKSDSSSSYFYDRLPDDDTKFFENGRIYNADGSVASNELLDREIFFHGYLHASLDDSLSQPDVNAFYNYLYALPAGEYMNLKSIADIRDRLNVPDWVALLIFAELLHEETIRASIAEVPDLFEAYPLDWVLRLLGISSDDINNFGNFDDAGVRMPGWVEDSFEDFCTVIELEKQYSVVESQIVLV